MMKKMMFGASWLLPLAILASELPAESLTASPASDFEALQQELLPVGPSRLVFGEKEQAIANALEMGGGMEKFYRDSSRVIQHTQAEVQGQPFRVVSTFTLEAKPPKYWDRSFRLLNTQPLHSGETLLAVFWARGTKAPQIVDDGAGATLQAYFHSSIGKFPKGRVSNFYDCKMLGTNWQRYLVKTDPLTQDFPPGTLALTGLIGHKAQTVEIGGLVVLAFPRDANLSALPHQSWDYPGRSLDAPWRQEADRRIDQFRKGNLSLTVVDANGKPVPNAKVHVKLRRHAFHFGVAVRVESFAGKTKGMAASDVEKYRDITTNHYSAIVLENELKWSAFEAGRAEEWKQTKACLAFYKQAGLWIRGHVLVWPTVYRTPAPIKDQFMKDPQQIGPGILAHIVEEISEFKSWVDDWDVTNETDVNRDFMDRLGPQGLVDWYRTARQTAGPDALLTFNEPLFGAAGMEIGSFPEKLLRPDCRGWVDYLNQQRAPLDVLGCQCHGGIVGMDYSGKTGAEALWAYYDHVSSYYKKKLQYTELDVAIGDPSDPDQLAYQADKLRDSIIIAFAHPAFVGVTQWGFWAGSHYAPNAALWNRDWSLRPVGQAYLDLVEKKWHTEADLVTDAQGACSLRAFYGTYEITVGSNETNRVSCDFPAGDKQVQIDIK